MAELRWLTDRSRMAAYGDCKRLRYLTYHFGGKGLQRTTASLPLINGDFVHKALASLITGGDLDSIVAALTKEYADTVRSRSVHNETDLEFLINEQCSLLEGLTRAWQRVRLPKILADYDVVDVEKEVEWELAPGITVMLRMDAVLRRKSDRLLFVKDYKTVGAIYDDWGRKFEHDSQLLCYTAAAEALYNEPIGGLLMEGLVKGKRMKERAATSPFQGLTIQQSPFCYGYRSPVAKGWNEYLYDKSWNRGAEKVPVWEIPGGIEHWLATEFSDLDLAEMFVPLPAIKPMKRDQLRWIAQMRYQEQQIAVDVEAVERARQHWEAQQDDDSWDNYQDLLNCAFPQNHNHCFRYSFNYPCPNEQICFTEEIEQDPVASGFYTPRIPHHSTEDE